MLPFAENIWIFDGAPVSVMGFHYPTRMTVIRLANGDLFVCSPIALTEELKQEVAALGPVAHIVAPNSLHHLSLAEWQTAFPEARMYAPPGLARKRDDLAFDADLDDSPAPEWAADIDQVAMVGNAITTEIVFFHRASGTAIFTDLLQNFPDGWHKGWRAKIAKLDLMSESVPTVPRKFRVAFTGRRDARVAIGRVLEWPVRHVLMAHGTPVKDTGAAFLQDAFGWLTKGPTLRR